MGQGSAARADADPGGRRDADAGRPVATDPGEDVPGDGPDPDASGVPGDDASDGTYSGILGAVPYALRATDSWLCKAYVVVGTLVTLLVTLLFLVGVVSAFVNTVGAVGGSFTFSRSFVFLVGVLVGLGLVAPVLLVARHHRLHGGSVDYDRTLATAGFGYALSLYLALLVSAPPGRREAPPAAIAPVVEALYALPAVAGIVPPVLAAALIYAGHRRYRARPAES